MMKKSVVLFIAMIWIGWSLAQEKSKFVYFETDYSVLDVHQQQVLSNWIAQFDSSQILQIQVTAHTDSDGSFDYNQRLSQKRLHTVRKAILETYPKLNILGTYQGETIPIADNSIPQGKALNRRVEIKVILKSNRDKKEEETILHLYNQLKTPSQYFHLNSEHDTIIECDQGTLITFKKNSLVLPSGKPAKGEITISVKEFYDKCSSFRENLTTVSNDDVLESRGMLYISAFKGNDALQLKDGTSMMCMMPTNNYDGNALLFNGTRTPHHNYMNWETDSLLPNEINNKYMIECCDLKEGYMCLTTWCSIKSFCYRYLYMRFIGFKKSERLYVKLNQSECERLDSLYALYGVSNFGELHAALRREKAKKIYDNLKSSKTVSIEDLSYYAFKSNDLGWINVDSFSDMKQEELVTMNVDLKIDPKVDTKLIFKNRNVILPPNMMDNEFGFKDVPKDEVVYFIALKYEKHQAYVSIQEVQLKGQLLKPQFEAVTIEELKQKLQEINMMF